MFIALWIAGAFAFRAYTILPDAIKMIPSDFMDKIDSDTRWLFDHYQWLLPIILIIWVFSLVSVWVRYRGSYLVIVLSFGVLSVGANQIASIAMKPVKQYKEYKQKRYSDFMESTDDSHIKKSG